MQGGQGKAGEGETRSWRGAAKELGAHLLGDRVNEPDVQVLLRADACGGGDGHKVRTSSPTLEIPNLSPAGARPKKLPRAVGGPVG